MRAASTIAADRALSGIITGLAEVEFIEDIGAALG